MLKVGVSSDSFKRQTSVKDSYKKANSLQYTTKEHQESVDTLVNAMSANKAKILGRWRERCQSLDSTSLLKSKSECGLNFSSFFVSHFFFFFFLFFFSLRCRL